MKLRGFGLAALCLLASGCLFRKRPPVPVSAIEAPTDAPAPPKLVSQSTTVVSESAPAVDIVPEIPKVLMPATRKAPKKAPKKGAAAAPAAKPRIWGQIAVTTSIVSPSQLVGPEVPYSPEYKKLPAFPEKLTFSVGWGVLSVGEATLKVEKLVMFNGRPAYHLVSEARSNAFCDSFHPVRDLNEAWLDAKTLTSLGYSKKLREGGFFRDEWVLFDRDAGTFVMRRVHKDGHFDLRVGTIPANVQDVLSTTYYTRTQQLAAGGAVIVDVNTPDNWPLAIKVGERSTVKVPAGKYPAILLEPEMRREGLFIQKGKRLRLWLSDDDRKAPVLMKVEVFFGHVTASLKEML